MRPAMRPVRAARIVLVLLAFTAVLTVQAQAPSPQATPSPTPGTRPATYQPGSNAQTGNTQSTQPTQPVSTAGLPSAAVLPKVVGLEGNLEADDLIKVDIDHLAEWAKTNNPAKLVPYLEGMALHGNYPIEVHTTQNHLRFHLHITAENKKTWINLLGGPTSTRKPVIFSVGLEQQSQFDTVYEPDNPALLTVISPVDGIVATLVVLLTLVMLIWLARKTSLIRDPGPRIVGGKLRRYNLGRTQMAFWFFMIYASYAVIWLITGALDTITPSLLGLMGISAGTALGAAMIDSGKETSKTNSLKELTAEKQALEQTIPQLQLQVDAVQAKAAMTPEDISSRDSLNKQLQDYRARLNQVGKKIEDLTPSGGEASEGFLRDILGDANGYSFHRFQIFAWTIVLGVIFVSSVYWDLSMPEFSTTLLGLMGISSGTYLGFKFPEQK